MGDQIFYNPNQVVQPQPVQKKQYKPFSNAYMLFLLFIFITNFIFVDFAMRKGFHIGFTISYFLIFTLGTVFSRYKNEKFQMTPFAIFAGAISLGTSVVFALHYNFTMNVLMTIMIIVLYILYLTNINGTRFDNYDVVDFIKTVIKGFFLDLFDNVGLTIGSFFAGAKKGRKIGQIILGIILAIPVLLISVYLLARNDAAFMEVVKTILKHVALYLFELILAVVMLPFTFSFLYSKKHKSEPTTAVNNIQKPERKYWSPTVCATFMFVLDFSYLIYLISQLKYVSGSELVSNSVDTSAFMLKSFFTVLVFCLLNVIIVGLIVHFTTQEKTPISIKIASSIMSGFTMCYILSAFLKIKMEIQTNGLMTYKILCIALLIVLFVLFGIIIAYIIKPTFNYMKSFIVVSSLALMCLGFANVNNICANYNINQFCKAEVSDTEFTKNVEPKMADVANMGVDAMPAVVDLAEYYKTHSKEENPQLDIRVHYAEYIMSYMMGQRVYYTNQKDFRAFYASKIMAQNKINKYINSLSPEYQQNFRTMMQMQKAKADDDNGYTETYDFGDVLNYAFSFNWADAFYAAEHIGNDDESIEHTRVFYYADDDAFFVEKYADDFDDADSYYLVYSNKTGLYEHKDSFERSYN